MLFWGASKSSTFVDENAPQLTPHNHVKWKLAVANDIELNTRLIYIWLSLATDEFIIFHIYHIFMAYHSQVPSLHSYVNQSTTDTEIFTWPRAAGHAWPWPMRSCRVNTYNFAGSDRGVLHCSPIASYVFFLLRICLNHGRLTVKPCKLHVCIGSFGLLNGI